MLFVDSVLQAVCRKEVRIMMKDADRLFLGLENMRFSVKPGERAPHSDIEFLRVLEEGEQEKNLSKIYEFIHAFERGNLGLTDEKVQKYLKKAYEISPWRLLQILEQKERFIEKYKILCMCDKDMKIYFALHTQQDTWLIYEAIRQIFSEQDLTEGDTAFTMAVLRLAEKDLNLWKRLLQENEYNKKWSRYLKYIWGKLGKEALRCYAENIRINLPAEYMQGVTEAFREMESEEQEYVLGEIAPILYERWKVYLQELRETAKTMNGLEITGYCNLILSAICYLFPEYKLWMEEFHKIMLGFEQDMLAWYSSESAMSVFYFTNLTQVYIFLYYGRKGRDWEIDAKTAQMMKETRRLILCYQYLWRNIDTIYEGTVKYSEGKTLFRELCQLLS